MWTLVKNSFGLFLAYGGFDKNNYLFGLYLIALIYLWITEKDKIRRAVFVYAPTILLFCYFTPIFQKVIVKLFSDSSTYYRILWLLQMGIETAYAMTRMVRHHRLIGFPLMTAAIVLCGSYVYNGTYMSDTTNSYHLPEEAMEVAEMISPDEGRVMAIVPSDLVYYIRQYDTSINMPYGREMLIAQWDYWSDIYTAMEETDSIETPDFVKLTRECGCDYIVLRKDRQLEAPLEDFNFDVYGETDTYIIYRDLNAERNYALFNIDKELSYAF